LQRIWIALAALSLSLGGGASGPAAYGGMVSADLTSEYAEAGLGKDGTSTLAAYSKQGRTTNGTFYTNLVSKGEDMSKTAPKPTETDIPIKVEQKDGSIEKYGPSVQLAKQKKSLIVEGLDAEEVVSVTGAYKGVGGQFIYPTKGVDTRYVGALALQDTSKGIPPKGSAAGSATDPFTVPGGSIYPYGDTIDASLQLSDSSSFGGVEFYAVDSSVFPSDDLDQFLEDGSPFAETLWSLSLTANGVLTDKSEVQVDFTLNPKALNEIGLPTSFLYTLPGYSPGLSQAEIADLVDTAIDDAISQSLTLQDGAVSLSEFPLFPAGTLFAPADDGVIYADGVNTVLSDVPEPGTLWLIGSGLIAWAWSRRVTGARAHRSVPLKPLRPRACI
jgi:hypothetical protein